MSDTPETDAAIKDQSEWKLPFVSATMDGVTYDGPVAALCRRLERERDDAREKAQQMSESNQVLMADVRFYRNAWEQLLKEATK